MWQYMCVYTGYVTVHVFIYWICNCINKHTFFFLIIIINFTVWLKQSLPTTIFYNWPIPKFQPLCYPRNLCMKIKNLFISRWNHFVPLTWKVSQSNIMLLFMHSLFFTHLFIALAEMFECPNLFPQYALCNSTSSFKVGESCWMWLHCSFIWTYPLEQGLNTILIAIVRCLMGMSSRLLEMEFQIICTQLKKRIVCLTASNGIPGGAGS